MNNIRELRLRLGLTQAQFGALIGARFQAISDWERGITTPIRATRSYLALLAWLEDNHPAIIDELLKHRKITLN